jgi:hypothetical protein
MIGVSTYASQDAADTAGQPSGDSAVVSGNQDTATHNAPASSTPPEIVLGDVQSFDVPVRLVWPSPSARILATRCSQGRWSFFELSEDGSRWLGPYFYEPWERIHWWKGTDFGWTKGPDGSEVLGLGYGRNLGVMVKDGTVVETNFEGSVPHPLFEPETGRTYWEAFTGKAEDMFAGLAERYESLKRAALEAANHKGFSTPALPDSVYMMYDISPDGIHVFCVLTLRYPDPLLCLDLTTGHLTMFQAEGHPRFLAGDHNGCFSPDGKWVLMRFQYHPDDHYSGGCIQILTPDGRFVRELTTVAEDIGARPGWSYWLHNDWIAYADGHRLFFRKYLGVPDAQDRSSPKP